MAFLRHVPDVARTKTPLPPTDHNTEIVSSPTFAPEVSTMAPSADTGQVKLAAKTWVCWYVTTSIHLIERTHIGSMAASIRRRRFLV